MSVLTVGIAEVTPSLNQYLGMHWAPRRKLRPKYAWALAVALRAAEWDGRPARRLRVTSYRARLMDYDNLVGGMKPLLDALVDCGVLVDDSPARASVSYAQVAGRRRETVIDLVGVKP